MSGTLSGSSCDSLHGFNRDSLHGSTRDSPSLAARCPAKSSMPLDVCAAPGCVEPPCTACPPTQTTADVVHKLTRDRAPVLERTRLRTRKRTRIQASIWHRSLQGDAIRVLRIPGTSSLWQPHRGGTGRRARLDRSRRRTRRPARVLWLSPTSVFFIPRSTTSCSKSTAHVTMAVPS